MSSMSYGRKVLIAIDQLCNAILRGWPDETLSSRAYRWHIQGKRSWVMSCIDWVFSVFGGELNHCEDSWRNEANRKHLPNSLREMS